MIAKLIDNTLLVRRFIERRPFWVFDKEVIDAFNDGIKLMNAIEESKNLSYHAGLIVEINKTVISINSALSQADALGRKKMLLYVKYRNTLKRIRKAVQTINKES